MFSWSSWDFKLDRLMLRNFKRRYKPHLPIRPNMTIVSAWEQRSAPKQVESIGRVDHCITVSLYTVHTVHTLYHCITEHNVHIVHSINSVHSIHSVHSVHIVHSVHRIYSIHIVYSICTVGTGIS